jgi:hypothetical protein
MTETLEEKLAKYRDMKVELAYPLEKLTTLEKEIKAHVKETGETAVIDGARITVTPPKKARVKWDVKGLEGVAALNPKILALKTEYWASPSIRIIVE